MVTGNLPSQFKVFVHGLNILASSCAVCTTDFPITGFDVQAHDKAMLRGASILLL